MPGKKVICNSPYAITSIEHLYITLKDGARLAARIFMPVKAQEGEKFPAVLEYIPYRKRDGTRTRDEPMHGFYAQNGYVAVRVDMRGAGDSDGLLRDEYLLQEQDDCLEVIDWISKQPWCTGSVGMQGKSWSGFNSLQVAARRPPALKAIIVLGFTDNRFTDDIHWKGGCLLNDNFWWGSIMEAYMSRPPDPECVGEENWKKMWLERLKALPMSQATWASHQCMDDYWKHGSVSTNYDDIQVPVLAVDGWADSYTNPVFRLMRHLNVPRRAIVGPWVHAYPQDGVPNPPMNFLREATNWWDHWLKEKKDNGAMDGPMVQAFIEDSLPPCTSKPECPGKWVGLPSWPAPESEIKNNTYLLGQHRALVDARVSGAAAATAPTIVHTPLNHGLLSGEWMGAGVLGETSGDQRMDNGMSVTFTSEVLDAPVDILGRPTFEVTLSCDKTKGLVFVQLCDVAPDGAATRISYGLQNLVHTSPDGYEKIVPVTPGEKMRVRVKLDYCGYQVPAGHRMSVSIANNYWPMVWCSPEDTTLTLHSETAAFHLPVMQNAAARVIAPPDTVPETAPATPVTTLTGGRVDRTIEYDLLRDTWKCVTDGVGGVFGEGIYRFDDIDTTVEHNLRRELTLCNRDPLSAKYTIVQKMKLSRPGWVTEMDIEESQTCDKDYLYLRTHVNAKLNDEQAFEKNEYKRVPRDAI